MWQHGSLHSLLSIQKRQWELRYVQNSGNFEFCLLSWREWEKESKILESGVVGEFLACMKRKARLENAVSALHLQFINELSRKMQTMI